MHTTTNRSSVVHNTFSIERTHPSPPSRVFAAFSNQETKRRWFAEGEGWEVDEFTAPEGMDLAHADDPNYKDWLSQWMELQKRHFSFHVNSYPTSVRRALHASVS